MSVEEFGPMLKDEVLPAVMDLIIGMKPLIPVFAEIATQIGESMPEMIETLIPMIEQMAHTFILLAPNHQDSHQGTTILDDIL